MQVPSLKMKSNKTFHLSLVFVFLGIFSSNLIAQESPNPYRKWILGVTGMGSFGFQNHKVGTYVSQDVSDETSDSKDLTISGGGGSGYRLIVGYRPLFYHRLPLLECLFQMGRQVSTFGVDVEGVNGKFYRNVFCFALNLKIPLKVYNSSEGALAYLNCIAGYGWYLNGKMDIDFHKIAGDHSIFDYKNSTGFHVGGELELCFNHWFSFIVGTQFHFVNYNIKSLSLNGILKNPDQAIDEFKNIDGSGIDFNLGLLFHL
jgi:hypothetical protein